ncbi:MAG: hypothetical protein LBU76_00325 [Azoarcus sp.]|nr:hypothetical protein [Azoarcus sp.]
MRTKIWSLIAMISLFGCSPPPVTEQAKLLGTREFSKEAWLTASQEKRGEMVSSFLSQHDLKSLTSNSVKELLGIPTGYYDYEENPAYFVGPSSVESEYGKGYLLVFIAEKTSGKIIAVKIIPEPK